MAKKKYKGNEKSKNIDMSMFELEKADNLENTDEVVNETGVALENIVNKKSDESEINSINEEKNINIEADNDESAQISTNVESEDGILSNEDVENEDGIISNGNEINTEKQSDITSENITNTEGVVNKKNEDVTQNYNDSKITDKSDEKRSGIKRYTGKLKSQEYISLEQESSVASVEADKQADEFDYENDAIVLPPMSPDSVAKSNTIEEGENIFSKPNEKIISNNYVPATHAVVVPPIGVVTSSGKTDSKETNSMKKDDETKSNTPKENKPKKGRKKTIIIVCSLLLVAVICVGGFAVHKKIQKDKQIAYMRSIVEVDTFYNGIIVGGIDLGGKTYQDAAQEIEELIRDEQSRAQIKVKFGSEEFILSRDDFVFEDNITEILDEAYAYARSGELEDRYNLIQKLETEPVNMVVGINVEKTDYRGFAQETIDAIDIEAQNASVEEFIVANKQFKFNAEVVGIKVDAERLLQDILSVLENQDWDRVIDVYIDTIQPEIILSDLSKRMGLIGTATTSTTSNSNRNQNIKLLSTTLSGARVEPGQVFSINETSGPRTLAKGYKPAGAIVQGILQDEPGGGVCQVSTTLYNALLKADVKIVERSHHSWPITYVSIGLDAAIDYPNQDLKFENNTNASLFVIAHFANQQLTFEIYGERILDDGVYIKLSSKEISSTPPGEPEYVNDPTLPEGETVLIRNARNERLSESFKSYYSANGVLIKTELLVKDRYRPIRALYNIGTMPVAPQITDPLIPPVIDEDNDIDNGNTDNDNWIN